jgi:putative phosphoesterase
MFDHQRIFWHDLGMRIAVLSDIHDNVWKLAAALRAIEAADELICCGDLCSPFIVHQMARGFQGPIHIVFGNNDGDLFRITANAQKYDHVQVHGEIMRRELNGKRIGCNHYDTIGRSLAASGEFDVVCFGHNHVHEIARIGKTLAINPGPIMGARFAPDTSPVDVASTLVIYDTQTDVAETLHV